jgi:O-antigen ligase
LSSSPLRPAALAVLAGWLLFAFAGTYTVFTVPFFVGVIALALRVRPRPILRPGMRALDIALVAAIAVIAVQMVPLPLQVIRDVAPLHDTVHDLLSAPAANVNLLSLDPSSTVVDLVLGTSYVLLFWTARTIFRGGGVRTMVRGIAWLGLALSLLVVVQRPTAPNLLYWLWVPKDGPGLAVFGPFVNRNHLATWLVLALPMVIGYWIAHNEVRHTDKVVDRLTRLARLLTPRTFWLLASIVLMTFVLTMTVSRSGLVGAAGALVTGAWLARGRVERKDRAWIAVAGTATLLVVLLYANLGALAARVDETLSATDGRQAIWRDTRLILRDFWQTGVGVGAYPQAMRVYQTGTRQRFFNQAHDQYLQFAAEGGVLLGVPLALTIGAFGWVVWGRLRNDHSPVYWIRAGAVSGMVGVAVQSVWETGLRMPADAALFALTAAVAVHKTHRSVFSSARIPRTTRGNPEREHHEPDVKPQRRTPDVDPVVAELVPSIDVAGSVDLGDAGQPGLDARAHRKAGHVLNPHHQPVGSDFDFSGA